VTTLEFRTVPEEQLGVATAAAAWLQSRGYRVTPELHEIGYPFTPTLFGKRGSTTAFVEVDAEVPLDRMQEWAGYGRSRRSDTRVWCAISETTSRTGKQDRQLKELGVGLLIVGGGEATEMIVAKDLALGVVLPSIKTLPPRLQQVLGPVYEHFDRAEWREGFAEACLALEDAARKHLWKGVRVGRIVIITGSGKQEQLTKEKVDRFTMGQLAGRFGRIIQQTHADRVIADTLKQVNPNRVGVVHYKRKAASEAKLRRNVGTQMWLIIGALKEIDRSP
jgi:hypothetical protein